MRSIRICQLKDEGETMRPRKVVPLGGGTSIWWYIRMGIRIFAFNWVLRGSAAKVARGLFDAYIHLVTMLF